MAVDARCARLSGVAGARARLLANDPPRQAKKPKNTTTLPPGAHCTAAMTRLHVLLVAGLVCALTAQSRAPERTGQVTTGILPIAGTTTATDAPSVPAPPRGVADPLPPKRTPPLRLTPGAAPDLPPGAPTRLRGPGPAGGNLVVVDDHAVNPPGASVGQVTEPTAAIHRDTAFYTGNWYAAVSGSSGRTWRHVNPYTTFPALDGGFCCDQSSLIIPGDDTNCLLIWLLQYGFSATTGRGSVRLAVSQGRDAIRQNTYYWYDLTPQVANYPTNCWLDFPDVAYSNDWLYVSCNVFDQNSAFVGTTVLRLRLADIRAIRPAGYNSFSTPSTDPGSLRLADGASNVMYFGSHTQISGAPAIRIFAWDDSITAPTMRDVAVAAWYTGTSSSVGPDGRDWLGRDDHRILGCYVARGVLGFLWGSAAGGSFPQPFVRIATFDTGRNFSRAGEATVWNPTSAFAYPSVAVNSRGDLGGMMAYGGGGHHPGSIAWVVDGQSSWGPLDNTVVARGARGPTNNGWGDYLSAARHSWHPSTYVGAGYALDANGNSVPHYAWFCRQNDVPPFATLTVTSTPVTGAAVDIDVPDRNGNRNGTTNFTRVYSPDQGLFVEAQREVTQGGIRYLFDFWRLNGTAQPPGQRDVTIPDLLGNPAASLEANYLRMRHTVQVSSSPANGANFSLTPNDFSNRSGGTTPMTLQYEDGVIFTITADATHNGAPFDRWIMDGVPSVPGFRSLMINSRNDHVLVAAYRPQVCGGFTPFGTTCNTSLGARHVASSSRSTCGPHVGDTVDYVMLDTNASVGGVLLIGASNTTWNGIPLPVAVPTQPSCFLRVEALVTIGFGINGVPGNGGVFGLRLPMNPDLINGRLFSQCVALGPLGFHQFSNGIETLIGGFP